MYYTDLDLVRARLASAEVPVGVKASYVQVLANLNAISVLLAPGDALEDDPAEAGQAELMALFSQHQRRRVALESEFPLLAVLTRPVGWRGN